MLNKKNRYKRGYNKNDNMHKSEAQEIMIDIDKYRVAGNITEYHIVSKLIFMPKLVIQHTDLLLIILE